MLRAILATSSNFQFSIFEFRVSNPRRSNDENTRAAHTLVPGNHSGGAAFRMVVLGTRRLRQPPRLLANHEEISRRWNSARAHRSLASLRSGVLGSYSAR